MTKKNKYTVRIELEGYETKIVGYLDQLVKTGLYGNNRGEVLKNLATKTLRRELRTDGLLRDIEKILKEK